MIGLILIFILIALFMISTHRLMDEKLLENANRYNKYKIYSYQGYRDVFTRYFVKESSLLCLVVNTNLCDS